LHGSDGGEWVADNEAAAVAEAALSDNEVASGW
jgi:hypothetical protein